MHDTSAIDRAGWPSSASRALIEGVPDGVLVLDGHGRVVMHNQAAAAMFGVPAGELVGEPLVGAWTFVDATGAPLEGPAHPLAQVHLDGRPVVRRTVGVQRHGGPQRWVHLRVRALGALPGMGQAVAVVFERATDPRANRSLHALGRQLGDDERVVDTLFAQRTVGLVQCGTDGVIQRVNQAFAAMVGAAGPDLVGRSLPGLIAAEDLTRNRSRILRLLHGGSDAYDGELRLVHTEGHTITATFGTSAIRDDDGRCTALLSLVVDTSRLRQVEHYVSSRALFDPLTQLISRTLLIDVLDEQLQTAHDGMALIALNLDRFRAVNDSLGQAAGDGVLIEVARRLRAVLRPGDSAARASGDDFVLLLMDTHTRSQAAARVEQILAAVGTPIAVEGLQVQLSASAGLSLVPAGSTPTSDEVIYQATAALAHAKQHGRARWTAFDGEVHGASVGRLRIESGLREALDTRRLDVAYQPVLDLRSDRVVGAEALVRWEDPVLGAVAPLEFLPVAEDSGLIAALGARVLGEALAAVAGWAAAGQSPTHVAVNLSPRELNRRGAAQRVAETLAAAGVAPQLLALEITESVLVHPDAQVVHNLRELRALGVRVGIDDFGTGYASMAYLRSLPVDFIKIDRAFVTDIADSPQDRAIVRALLDLATALDLDTVAEGIETPAQLDVLRELGCRLGQGFLIGRPQSATAVGDLVAQIADAPYWPTGGGG